MLYSMAGLTELQQLMLVLATVVSAVVGIFAFNWLLLTLISARQSKSASRPPVVKEWPRVSIHLPVYNERNVIKRLIQSCIDIDYPRDKLEIVVIDDSNDETTEIARSFENRYPDLVRMIHRERRSGFKGGALQTGLENSNGEFIAIFDADFVPSPGFLKEMIPYVYQDPGIAFVQARVGHLNQDQSWITRGIALAIDIYFLVDQRARYAKNLLAHFSGTSGVFRRSAIEAVGGWSSDTVVEDLDLSIRLQLQGWKYIYVPHVVCAGEVPSSLSDFRTQQSRWARGFTQCIRKYASSIISHKRLSIFQKFEALMLLLTYFIYPISAFGMLLSIPYYSMFPVSFFLDDYWNTIFAPLIAFFSMAIYATPFFACATTVSELRRQGDTKKGLRSIPYLALVGLNVLFSNSLALLQSLHSYATTFDRTPKIGFVDQSLRYQLATRNRMKNMLDSSVESEPEIPQLS